MNAADQALFGDALGCDQHLPLSFTACDAEALRVSEAHSAQIVLRALAQLEPVSVKEAEERDAGKAADIERIESKVDLMLALLGDLIRERGSWPPAQPIRWSRLGARFASDQLWQAGDYGRLRILPDACVPKCLVLPARVQAVEAAAGRAGCVVWCRFHQLDAGLENALERHLFRVHRRQLAEARRGQLHSS